jgi:hypothetical protein
LNQNGFDGTYLQMKKLGVGVLALLICGCTDSQTPSVKNQPVEAGYVIGLGEIMGLTQMRHAKLWFAGQAANWELVEYEMDELKEGFEDAVKYHPNHKAVPQPLTEMMPAFMDVPVAELDAAVKAKSVSQFTKAYDGLTASCNACHQASNFGFNVVIRPTVPPYSNQDFRQ